ncbi:uncharacterized protein DS421_19g672610 [Arachis hypogaea]|uniref:Uncharacterized protein n=1 Tax=Arachis hypogaea TaxID=3818 RepID=A0A6B9VF66_ARAHY|nr:uncharacterized protein DS421_19g672610 [Arachis hypogaea]
MEEAEIGADEVIIIMKHQGPEVHLGEQAKDGALGLMKSDDQGRTRGNCMLGFTWLSLLSLCGRTRSVSWRRRSWLGFWLQKWRLPSSIKRENSHCLEQGESVRVQGTEFSELPELTVFSSPSMYYV